MSSPRPPLFDDGGGLPETGTSSSASLPPPSGSRATVGGGGPNYLARRALVVGGVVLAVVVVAVVIGRLIGASDDGGSAGEITGEWDTVVLVADDEVRLVDPESGDVVDRFAGNEPLLDAESLTTGSTLVLMNDDARITQLDLAEGTTRRSRATIDSTLTRSADHPALVLAGPPVGGNVTVVDTRSGDTVDVGQVAGLTEPLMFVEEVRINASGTHLATADARSFQSVVVDISAETTELLAGQVVAINDTTVLTAQRAGDETELEFYDLAGERTGSVDVPTPAATMLTGESTALIVTADGQVFRVESGGGIDEVGSLGESDANEAVAADEGSSDSVADDEGGAIAVTPTVNVQAGRPAMYDRRLAVVTTEEVIVLDERGNVVTRAEGTLLSRAVRSSTCVLVGSAEATGRAVHLDIDEGAELGTVAGGLVGSSSVDGCTVALIAGVEPRVVQSGTEVDIAASSGSATVAPDGSAYVLSTFTGEQLVSIVEQADGDTVDLADDPVLTRFADVGS